MPCYGKVPAVPTQAKCGGGWGVGGLTKRKLMDRQRQTEVHYPGVHELFQQFHVTLDAPVAISEHTRPDRCVRACARVCAYQRA